MNGRLQKQVIIGLVFVLLLGGAAYGIFDKLFLIEATCFDQVQNGKEEGVDCGTLACGKLCEEPVRPLEVLMEKVIEVRPGDYDFVAQISNPNTNYGASRIEYHIPEFNRSGSSYILPGQTKYLVVTSLKSNQPVSSAKLLVSSVTWEKLDIPENEVSIEMVREGMVNSGQGSSLEGVLSNNSSYDFDTVEVSVILFSAEGGPGSGGGDTIIGVNKTEIKTFLSKTERGFLVQWPSEQKGVSRTHFEISTNLFENSNFIKSHGTQEKFQKFY